MNNNKLNKIIIFGTSGHAKVCIDILELQKYKILGLVSNNIAEKGKIINDIPILGKDDDLTINKLLKDRNIDYFVAIGDNGTRRKVINKIIKRFKKFPINAIHPDSTISRYVKLGYGNFINCGVKINVDAIIGNGVIVNTSATIDHDAVLNDYSQISPGVNLAGGVIVGRSVFIGTGAAVIPKIRIDEESIIGAGTVVIRDIQKKVIAVGCPAKVIKKL